MEGIGVRPVQLLHRLPRRDLFTIASSAVAASLTTPGCSTRSGTCEALREDLRLRYFLVMMIGIAVPGAGGQGPTPSDHKATFIQRREIGAVRGPFGTGNPACCLSSGTRRLEKSDPDRGPRKEPSSDHGRRAGLSRPRHSEREHGPLLLWTRTGSPRRAQLPAGSLGAPRSRSRRSSTSWSGPPGGARRCLAESVGLFLWVVLSALRTLSLGKTCDDTSTAVEVRHAAASSVADGLLSGLFGAEMERRVRRCLQRRRLPSCLMFDCFATRAGSRWSSLDETVVGRMGR